MKSNFDTYSTNTMAYLALRAMKDVANLRIQDGGFEALVVENIYSWLEKIDENFEEGVDIQQLKEEIHTELLEGPFLDNGGGPFLANAMDFLGESYASYKFFEWVWEAVQDIKREDSEVNDKN